MKQLVKKRLFDELIGACLGKNGYVIMIIDVNEDDIEPGIIDNDTGQVNVKVLYTALLFRPFKNEVIDAVVTSASDETCINLRMGPIKVIVSRNQIPVDYQFDYTRGDCWVSDDGEVEIREGSVVRLRIMGLTVNADSMDVVGDLKEEYLGKVGGV